MNVCAACHSAAERPSRARYIPVGRVCYRPRPWRNHCMRVLCCVLAAGITMALAAPACAKVEKFVGIRTEMIKTDGATIYVRVGGKGPAVVMLHGFGDTGDMWAPLANALIKDHTVIVPD